MGHLASKIQVWRVTWGPQKHWHWESHFLEKIPKWEQPSHMDAQWDIKRRNQDSWAKVALRLMGGTPIVCSPERNDGAELGTGFLSTPWPIQGHTSPDKSQLDSRWRTWRTTGPGLSAFLCHQAWRPVVFPEHLAKGRGMRQRTITDGWRH